MENPSSRTDPRILRTRRLLRNAFVELLEEMDIEKISVNRIAERATINRVTFYLHYKDIPDMLENLADGMIEDIHSILHKKDTENGQAPNEERWSVMEDVLEYIAEQADFYKIVLAKKRIPIFTERLLKLCTELIEARLERKGSDSFITAAGIPKDIAKWYLSSALIGTIVSWLKNDMPYTPHFLAKQFSLLMPHDLDNQK